MNLSNGSYREHDGDSWVVCTGSDDLEFIRRSFGVWEVLGADFKTMEEEVMVDRSFWGV